MKYFLLLTDTPLLLAGAVLCETGLKKLKRLTPHAEKLIVAEETTAFNANSYEYVHVNEIDADPSCGERNVFHDHNGNEWHN